ncbi:MAG: tRNA threonylcarbamoyladenosine dehydratase, partial [Oscillospiraceae bacterium]
GTGNKLDPSQFSVTDISKTEGCPLARIIRKELRVRGILHHKVVFSPELSAPLFSPAFGDEAPPPGRRSIPASAPWVPPVAGFLLAGAVVQDLIK